MLIRSQTTADSLHCRFFFRCQVHAWGLQFLQHIHCTDYKLYTVIAVCVLKYHCVVYMVICLYVDACSPRIKLIISIIRVCAHNHNNITISYKVMLKQFCPKYTLCILNSIRKFRSPASS